MTQGISTHLAACRVLMVEDSDAVSALHLGYMGDAPWRSSAVACARDAMQALRACAPTLVLLDLELPDAKEFELFDCIRAEAPKAAIIVLTGHASIGNAVRAVQAGALDFLEKPVTRDRLLRSVGNALECVVLRRQVDVLLHGRDQFHGFIGASVPMQGVYRMIEAAAPSKATIFITGESGTGKEVCAYAIHDESSRAGGPFVAVNCAAIPRDLIESELFGHVKGAFTGALMARVGAAEQADRGTLFLDEIGELNLDLQSKLLRFLQTGLIKRVGANYERKVDVRIVCATNRDPRAEVRAGRFREDLYYRLNVIPVHLPPLRERGEDVQLLARAFLQRFVREEGKRCDGFTTAALERIQQHPWPGNVRELQNAIRRAVVLASGGRIDASAIALDPRTTLHASQLQMVSRSDHPVVEPLAATERRAVEHAINTCGGNIPRAARMLEVSPSTVYRKLQTWSGLVRVGAATATSIRH